MLDPASPRGRVALAVAAGIVALVGMVVSIREGREPVPEGVAGPGTPPAEPSGAEVSGKVAQAPITDEAERLAYVEKFVQVAGVDVGPDTKADLDGGVVEVGGVLKVVGQVENRGDRAVTTAQLSLQVFDGAGLPIGSYFEDVVGRKRLDPGESRPFKFTIPRKKEYGGKFSYKLR